MKKIIILVILLCYYSFNVFAIETQQLLVENVYKQPYTIHNSKNVEWDLFRGTAYTMIGGSLATVGLLYLMPESFTNWDKDESGDIFKKWHKHVKAGPVTDHDDAFLNYVAHPYCGAWYYMAGRSSGIGVFGSFLYSFAFSTFFWEYGIEAFAEIPSKQDLIITPVGGTIVGEGFYFLKRYIIDNDYKLLNSKFFGKLMIWLMDPATEITKLFFDRYDENKVVIMPMVSKYKDNFTYGISWSVEL